MTMDQITEIVRDINSILWGPWCLIPILVGTGIFFTFKTRFVQVRQFGRAFRHVFGNFSFSGEKAGQHGMTSFQSLATSIAAQVGTGNLAGVATAMVMGGPGAIFWMWVAAFFGMATIFAEAVLAQVYRTRDGQGHITGGPSYYIYKGLGLKSLSIIFAILIIVALGFIGNMVQANSITTAFSSAFNVPNWFSGMILICLAGFIFIGGIKRIASFAEKIVPFMAGVYVLGAVYIMLINYDMVLPAFKAIIIGAFNPEAATGGVIGASIKEAIRYGVARGLFSNEAGMGSTPHAHAVAKVDHPAEQGYVAMMGVFIDTFVILTLTALVILTSHCAVTGGLLPQVTTAGTVVEGGLTGTALTQAGFSAVFGKFGEIFIAICMFFFAFSTIIGWYFFGEANIKYMFGSKAVKIYAALVAVCIVAGSAQKVELIWNMSDCFNSAMVIPNVIGLVALTGVVKKVHKDYQQNFKPKQKNK